MKKEVQFYLVLALGVVIFMLLEHQPQSQNSISSSKIINVESFERLDIDLPCSVYVSIGDKQRVVFEGPETMLNAIEATYENGVLVLSERAKGLFQVFQSRRTEARKVNLYITLTSPDQLVTPTPGPIITQELSLQSLSENQQFSYRTTLSSIFGFIAHQERCIGMVSL
jgi:hypothetical protein